MADDQTQQQDQNIQNDTEGEMEKGGQVSDESEFEGDLGETEYEDE